ncbi:MAG: transcriptional regulator [Methylotenera sp.]|nr:MAG: transcriptional regulator [Methylotenera sp.]
MKVKTKSVSGLDSQAAGSLNRSSILINSIARGSRQGSLLTELVSRTGLPRPTIHRILDMLIDIGWIIRDEHSSRFKLGSDLAAIGYTAITHNPLERIASLQLSKLAEALNQTIYLSVRSGLDMVCIGRYESQAQIIVGRGWVGMRGPLGMSPSCMGMFSKMPHDEVQEIINANIARYHRIKGFDELGFRRSVEESKKRGYGVYDNILLDRTTSGLGAAILDSSGYPIASIGTTYITNWLSEDQKQNCSQKLIDVSLEIALEVLCFGNDHAS